MKKEYVTKYMDELGTTMVFRYDIYPNKIVNQYIVDFYAGKPNDEDTQDIINNDNGGDWVCSFDSNGLFIND